MQSIALSLRETPPILKIENEIEIFWKHMKMLTGDDALYSPVWQTLSWGGTLVASKQVDDVIFFGTYDGSELIGYGIGEVRSVWLGLSALFFVGWPQYFLGNTAIEDELIHKIEVFARIQWYAFVLFESLMEISHASLVCYTDQTKYLLEPTTRLLDLSQSTDELLADMKQKGRYNIKIAEKSDCVVLHVDPTPENIDSFYRLLLQTTERDGFSPNKKSYYEQILVDRHHPAEWLYFAISNEKVVSAAILVVSGNTAIYYYGASSSSSEDRKLMSPYLLQWEMIQSSKNSWCLWYDFLGIAPEGEEIGHHLQGVTDFKSKFWGIKRKWPQKKIYVSHTTKYILYRISRTVKNYMIRMKL